MRQSCRSPESSDSPRLRESECTWGVQCLSLIHILFGGHEDFPAAIIDEGIELCKRVTAGTDDRVEYVIPFPPGQQSKVLFAAKMKSFYRRVDGKDMNLQYSLDNIYFSGKRSRVLTEQAPKVKRIYPLD